MGVSKTRGRDRGQCRGRVLFFFLVKNAVLGLGLPLVSSLTLTLVLKQHSLKKEIDADPGLGPTPRFTDTPKLMVAIILI